MPEQRIGGAVVIFDERRRVLLVRHNYGRRNWEIPGGGGGPGESALETARREAREELGVELDVVRLTGVYFETEWRPGVEAHHFVFECRLRKGETPTITDRDEIADLGYFAIDDLPRPISDFTVLRIRDAAARRDPLVTAIGPRVWLD